MTLVIAIILTTEKSTLVQVIDWCRQETSHFPNQCWTRGPFHEGFSTVIQIRWKIGLSVLPSLGTIPLQNFCTCHNSTAAVPCWLDWINEDTRPSGHISRPTQVNVSQSCFHSLNKLLKLNHIVQDWRLVEINCVISDRRIPLLAGIPLCMSQELSRRGYSISQLCSIRHDIPVPPHTPGAYDQCWVFDHSGDKQWVVLGTRYGT